ncbi:MULTISPECIES: GNAT family N-acetyltransferase [Bacillus]|uniref:GNAT family N-acetyltransferase n=1 Tax=Bacillus TaxID=1386 RepID=UPI00077ADFBF|nr:MULTISPECIES: GNAT family N-acetyltransferase [Bacillus cereus group]KXY68872.1 hypothetical protein AT270_28565 [Bacillus cereus]MED2996888.1 GNAT family N-acetyltransferase [Bacillus tropicus]
MKVYKLVDDNLLIREITEKDIELIRKWRNQADIRQYFIDNNYIDKNQQKEWFKKYSQKKDDIMFVIEETLEFKKVIGTVALYNIDSKNNSVEFGRLMIGHLPYIGKGFGKKATILACKYAFEILSVSEIYLNVLSHNVKAIQLYCDIGFIKKNVSSDRIYMMLSRDAFF